MTSLEYWFVMHDNSLSSSLPTQLGNFVNLVRY